MSYAFLLARDKEEANSVSNFTINRKSVDTIDNELKLDTEDERPDSNHNIIVLD